MTADTASSRDDAEGRPSRRRRWKLISTGLFLVGMITIVLGLVLPVNHYTPWGYAGEELLMPAGTPLTMLQSPQGFFNELFGGLPGFDAGKTMVWFGVLFALAGAISLVISFTYPTKEVIAQRVAEDGVRWREAEQRAIAARAEAQQRALQAQAEQIRQYEAAYALAHDGQKPPDGGFVPVPMTSQRTNPLAIVALIGGLTTSLGGVIFGHIALAQIKRTGEQGKGLAIAGLVLGYVYLGGIALLVLLALAFGRH